MEKKQHETCMETRTFGISASGEIVTAIVLKTDEMIAEILDYGATLRSLQVKDRSGSWVDVVLGYDTLEEYETNDGYLGAVIGRNANRIGKGSFVLNGTVYRLACNNGENHLHGGNRGFDSYIWNYSVLKDGVRFSRTSPDGEEGYPGTMDVHVTYRFLPGCSLSLTYEAVSDQDTLCNLTNHSYFNLEGSGSILEHSLQVSADFFSENDSGCLPTGTLLPTAQTPFDFRQPKPIGREIHAADAQLAAGKGYDHNFALNPQCHDLPVAVLHSPKTGIKMALYTTLPGLQVYTANVLTERKGKNGAVYHPNAAVCLETQFFPNAMAFDTFEKPILKAGESFLHKTVFCFSAE